MGMRSLVETLRFRAELRSDSVRAARRLGVEIGTGCRLINLTRSTFGSEPFLVTMGDRVEVAAEVRFVTHDGGVWVLRDRHPDLDVVAPIRVGSNVFIGIGVVILPGVTIGDNVVIGARSVVNKDLAGGAVYAGVPARRLSTIADYEAKSLARGVPTKRMDPQSKRSALIKLR